MDVITLGIRIDANGAVTVLDQFGNKAEQVGRKTDVLERSVGSLKKGLAAFGLGISGGALFRKMIEETVQAQKEMARLEAVVRSTGGAAGFTVRDLDRMAEAFSKVSSFSDGAVKAGMARLLTYTAIQGDMFEKATQAALDMAEALGTDVATAAERVGNALNYPSQALGSLSKQGFRFTEEQKRMIKEFEATGQIAKAQAIIMEELELAYGDTARMARNTLGGALNNLQNEFAKLMTATDDHADGMIRAIDRVANALPDVRARFNSTFNTLVGEMEKVALKLNNIALDASNAGLILHAAFTFDFKELENVAAQIKKMEDNAKEYERVVNRLKGNKLRLDDPLAERNELAGLRSLGKPAGVDTPGFTDAANARIAAMQGELEKLNALNAARNKTEAQLKILEILYDAQTENSKLAQEFFGKELAALQGLNNATANARIEAIRLAEAKKDEAFARNQAADAAKRELDVALKILNAAEKDRATFQGQLFGNVSAGGRSLDQATQDSVAEAIAITVKWTKELNKGFDELHKSTATAARVIGQAIEYGIVQKLGGGTVGGNLGAAAAKAGVQELAGEFSAFGSKALGAAIFGPLVAGAGAVLGNAASSLADDLFGLTGASKAAAAALREMQKSFDESMADFQRRAAGAENSLAAREEKVRREAEQLRLNAAGAFPGSGPWWDPNQGGNPALQSRLNEINEAERRYIQLLRDEVALKNQIMVEDLRVRRLRAEGRDEEADAMAFVIQQQREYAQAVRDGMDALTLELLIRVQNEEAVRRKADAEKAAAEETIRLAEELQRKADELRAANDRMQGDASVRILSALGMNREAEDLAMGLNARREMEEAIKAGMSPATLAMLALAHVIEREALNTARAIEDQTKAINEATKAQTDSLDRQMAAVRLISDVEQKAMEQQTDSIRAQARADAKSYADQIDTIRQASKDEQAAFASQLDVLRQSLSVARDSLRAQEKAVSETQRVLDSLRKFSSGLSLNTSLTTLSPVEQLREARRQYEETLALASGGDKTAAGSLPEIARAFLEASRGVNASGSGYVSDFMRVQETLASVTDQFGAQLSVEERILSELEAQHATLEAQIAATQLAREQAAANAAQQIEALQTAKEVAAEHAAAQIEALQLAREQARESAARQLEELQRAKDAAREAADAQIEALTKQLHESLKAYAESLKFYNEWKRQSDDMLASNIRYFAEMVEKLGGIIENTFKTAENTKNALQRPGWEELIKPIGTLPELVKEANAELRASNGELKATVSVLAAGFTTLNAKVDGLQAELEHNSRATVNGLEAVRLSAK